MPDISMCPGNNCPIKDSCYRHKAMPNGDRQSWADFQYDHEQDVCGGFVRLWGSNFFGFVEQGDES